MEELCYTILGMGLGIVVQQIHEKLSKKQKQNKTQQQNKGTKKYLPSTPDMKKAYQEQKQNFLIRQASQQEVGDTIRKIVKIQGKISGFDNDDELNQIQDSQEEIKEDDDSQQHSLDKAFQPKTPNFQSKTSTSQNITLVTTSQVVSGELSLGLLQSNQFSDSKKNISPPGESKEQIIISSDPE
ncbi:unnamed protein product [Paramecium primaurelia]|uniref:Uncharacterized protein n=1 Tax=Paramecium primaurelia TaxID=5886 RepID=A0A8S1PKW4_PARPR|nr:unnamed protein product [Paramecium primaurelia]